MPRPKKQQKHLAHLAHCQKLKKRRIELVQQHEQHSTSIVDDAVDSVAMDSNTMDSDATEDDTFDDIDELMGDNGSANAAFASLLKWTVGAECKFRAFQTGNSRSWQAKKKQEERAGVLLMAKSKKINAYFQPVIKLSLSYTALMDGALQPPTEQSVVEPLLTDADPIDIAVQRLKEMNLTTNNQRLIKKHTHRSFEKLRLLAVFRRLKASQAIASGNSYRAKAIRQWSDYYVINLKLPDLRQGKHQKTESLIDDEDTAVCV